MSAPTPAVVMVDDGRTSLGKSARFGRRYPLRTVLPRGLEAIVRTETVIGIGEDEVTAGELIPDSFKPPTPPALAITVRNLGDVETLGGKDAVTQNAGPLHGLDRPGTVAD